jgi:hypothetical protein
MLLAGDEFRRTQRGNNNAYCQDNNTSWIDWSLAEQHQELGASPDTSWRFGGPTRCCDGKRSIPTEMSSGLIRLVARRTGSTRIKDGSRVWSAESMVQIST